MRTAGDRSWFAKGTAALLARLGLRKLKDPVFGEIRFRSSGTCWHGRGWFDPVGREIGLTICAGLNGATDAQREAYRRIQSEYPSQLSSIMEVLLPEYQSICDAQPEEGRPPAKLSDDLKRLVWLDRIVLSDVAGEFTLCYQTEIDDGGDHEFGVHFKDGKPALAAWEG